MKEILFFQPNFSYLSVSRPTDCSTFSNDAERKRDCNETPLIRTLMGLENSVLNRGVYLLEGFILTETKALVTDSTVLIRGVSC